MLNLDHQNPSAVRRDEGSLSIANHIKKEEQLRQKLDLERASKRELVERLHAEKEEIKHKSKLVVDMFKQKIAETESQLIYNKNRFDHISHRSSLTGELLRDHIAKWKLWNESLQCCESMEVFADYLLNQPMKFISASDSTAAVGVSAPSEIPSLMITELDQILSFITNIGLEVQLDNIPYFTLVPVVDAVQARATTRPTEGSRSKATSATTKTSSRDETTKSSLSPIRRPLSSLDTNTGTFSASSSPLQSPMSARVPRPLSSKGSSRRRSGGLGIGIPGSPSFSFFDDESSEPICLACAASTASVADLSARLKASQEQVTAQTEQCNTLTSTLSSTQDTLLEREQCIVDLRDQQSLLQSQLAAEHNTRVGAEQQLSALAEDRTALNNTLTTEQAARAKATEQVEALSSTVQKLEGKVVRLKSALEKSKQETSDVRDTLQRERDTHSNLLLRHTIELEAAALAASQRASEFNAQLDYYKALAAGPTATISALRAELQSRDVELIETTSRLAQQLEAMGASELYLRALLEESQGREEKEKARSATNEDALRAELLSMEEVCRQLDSFAQRRNDEAIELAIQLQQSKEQHAVELAGFAVRIEEAAAALEASREEVTARDSEVHTLSEQAAERVAIIAELEKKMEVAEMARAVLLDELSSSARSLQDSSEHAGRLEEQVSGLQALLEETVRVAQQEASESAEEFGRKSLKERLEADRILQLAQEEHSLALQGLQRKLTEALRSVDDLTAQMQGRDAELQQLSATLMNQAEVKNLLAAAKLEADAQSAELEELKLRFAEQTDEVAVKRSAMVTRIALLTTDLQSSEATVVLLTSSAEALQDKIASVLAKLDAEEQKVEHLTEEVNRLDTEASALRADHESDVELLRQLREESALLQDQLTALEASAQVEKSALVEHIADLEQRHSELCDVKSLLDEELEGLRTCAADAEALKVDLASASARCRELEEQVLEQSILAASFEAQQLVWESTVAERDQLYAASADETTEMRHQLQQSILRAQALERSLGECQNELELFKECSERVSGERDEAQEQLEATSAALEEIQSDLALLQTRARCLEEECGQLKAQLLEYTNVVAVHEEKMTKLQQRLIDAELGSKQSAADADVLRGKLRECEAAIAEGHNALAKRNMELDVLQQSLRETERLKDATEVKFTELEESYLRVVGKLEVRIADLVIERDTLRESVAELRTASELTGSTLSESNTTIAQLQQAAVAYREEIETLTAELNVQRQGVLDVYTDLNAQSSALADLESQLSEQSKSFEEEKKSMMQGLHSRQVAFTAALAELQLKSDHAVSSLRSNLLASLALEQNEVKDLVVKLAARNAQYEGLSAQCEELVSESKKVQLEHDEVLGANQQLQSAIAGLTANLESTKSTMEELTNRIEDRDQEFAQLQTNLEVLQAELATAREHAVEREESIYGLQLCVQATEQDRIALQKTFNATTSAHLSAVSEAADRLGKIAHERDSMQAERDALAVSVACLKIEVDSLINNLALAEATAADLQSAAESACRTHAEEAAVLTSRLEASSAARQVLEERLREFEAFGATSSEQLRLTLEQRDALQSELATTKEELSEQEREYRALVARHEELSFSARATEKALTEMQSSFITTRTQLEEASELSKSRLLECESASTQIETLQAIVESLRSDISDRDATIQEMRALLDAEGLELAALKEEFSSVKSQLNDQLRASRVQVEELEQRIGEEVAAVGIVAGALQALQIAHEEQQRTAECAAAGHSDCVAELTVRIECLELESAELLRELEAVQLERNDLRSARGSLMVQAMNLQESISALQATSTSQQASLKMTESALDEQVAKLRHSEVLLQHAEDKCAALSANLAAKEEECVALGAEIAECKAALLSAETTCAELTQRIADRERELSESTARTSAQAAALEATISSLSAQVQELESARSVLQAATEAVEQAHQIAVAEHTMRAEKLEIRLLEFEALGASSSEQLRLTLEQRDAVQSECDSVSAHLLSARQTIADMEAGAERAVAAHEEALALLSSRLEDTNVRYAIALEERVQQAQEFDAQKANMRRTIAETEDKLSSVCADLEHQDSIHREAMAAAETERVQWKHISAQRDLALCLMIKELSRANLECKSLGAEVADVREIELLQLSQLTALCKRVVQSEAALMELDACAVERNQELNSLAAGSAATIAQHEASLSALHEKLQAAEAALKQADAEAVRQASVLEEVQSRLHEFEAQGASSSQQLRLTLAQCDALQDKQAELMCTIAALEADVETAQRRLASVEEELGCVRAKSAARQLESEGQRDALEKDLASLQVERTSLEVDLSEVRGKLALQSTQHDQSVSALQDALEERTQSLHEAAAALLNSENARCALVLRCVALSSELAALNENEAKLLEDVESLKERVRVTESAVRDLDECVVQCNRELINFHHTSSATAADLTAEIDSARLQIAALNGKIEQFAAAKEDAAQRAAESEALHLAASAVASEQLRALVQQRDGLQVACEALQTAKAALEEQFHALQSEFRQQELLHAESVAQLSADLLRHHELREEQQASVHLLQSELASLSDALEASQHELSVQQTSAEEAAAHHAAAVADFDSRIEKVEADRATSIAALEIRLRDYEAMSADSSEQLRLTLEQRDDLQRRSADLARSVEEKVAEMAALHQQVNETSASNSEVRAACATLQAALEQKESALVGSSSELSDAHAAVKRLEADCAAVHIAVSVKEQEMEAMLVEIVTLTAAAKQAEETTQQRDATILKLESAVAESAQKVQSSEAAVACALKESADLTRALQARDSEIGARTLHYSVLSRQLIEHIDRIGECEHELVALESEVYMSEAAAVNLRIKLYAAESAIRELDAQCVEKNHDLDILTSSSSAAIAAASAEAKALVEAVSSLEIIAAQRDDTIQSMTTAHAALESSLQANVVAYKQAKHAHAEQLAMVDRCHAEATVLLEKRLCEFEALGSATSEQLRLALHQRDALEVERDGLQQAIAGLEEQLSSLQQDLEDKTAAHSEEKESLESELAHKCALLKDCDCAISTLQTEVASLQASLAAAHQTTEEERISAKVTVAALTEQLCQAEQEYKALQIDLHSAQDKLATANEELGSLRLNLEQQSRDHSTTVAFLRSELDQRSGCLKQVSQALAGAEERMEQTSAEMTTYQSLLNSAETQLANCTAEIHRLKTVLAEEECVRTHLEESAALGRAENAQLEDQRCAAELRCSSLESNLLDVEKNLRIALKESTTLAAQLADQTTHFDSLSKAAQGSEESLLAQNAQLCRDMAVAQEELRCVRELSLEQDSELQAMEVKLAEHLETISACTAHIAELEASGRSLSETLSATQTELETARLEMKAAESCFGTEREKLRGQIEELDSDAQGLRSTIAELQDQLASVSLSSVAQNSTINELTVQLTTVRDNSAAIECELSLQLALLSAELEKNRAQQQALESELSELSTKRTASTARVAELEDAVQSLTERLSTSEAESQANRCAAEATRLALVKERDELQAQVAALNIAVQSLQNAIGELEMQLNSALTESATHAQIVSQLTEQRENASADHIAVEARLTSLVAHLTSELAAVQEKLMGATVACAEKDTQREALQTEVNELRALVEMRDERIAELEESVKSATVRITAAEAELKSSQDMLDMAKTSVAAEREELNALVNDLREAIVQLEGRLASVSADSVAHIESIDLLSQQLAASREACASAEEKVAVLSVLNADLTSTVSDHDVRISDLVSQVSTLQSTSEAQAVALSTAADQLKKEKKKSQQLQKNVQHIEEQVHTQEKLVQEKCTALAELKDELHRAEKQIDMLMTEATAAAVQYKTLHSALVREQELHAACVDSEELVKARAAELQELLGQCEDQLAAAVDASSVHLDTIRVFTEDLAVSRNAHATAEEINSKLSLLNRDLSCTAEERAAQVSEIQVQLTELQASTTRDIAALEESVAQLEVQIAESTAECEQEKLTGAALSEQLRQEKSAAQVLNQQLSEASASLTETHHKLDFACAEIESLRTDALATAAHCQNIERLLAESEAAHNSSVLALESLRAELAVAEAVVSERSEELTASKALADRLNKSVAVHTSVVAGLEKQLLVAQFELEENQISAGHLSAELAQVKQGAEALKMEIERKSAEMLVLEQRLGSSVEERAFSECRLRDASAEVIADLQAQLQDLSTQLAASTSSVETQRHMSAARDAEFNALQKDLLAVREGLASALAAAEEEQSVHELESLNLNGKIAEKEFAIRELTVEIGNMTEELNHREEEQAATNLKLHELQQRVLELSEEKAALEAHLARLEAEHARVVSDFTELQSTSSSDAAALQVDQASLHALATELVEAKAAFQHCQAQLKEKKSSVTALTAELARQTESFLLLEHRLAEKVSAESALLSELSTLQQHGSTLKAELKRSQADVSALSARLKESFAEMSHLRDSQANEVTLLRQNIDQREVALQELNDRLLEQMEQSDELKRQMQEATAASSKMNRDLRERNDELEELHVEHGVLGAQEHIHSKEISDLKAQLHAAETALANLKQELHVRTLESADLAVSMKQRQGGIQQLAATLTDKDKQIQQLHSELSTVRNKLHAADEKSVKLSVQVKSLTNAIDDLRALQASQEKVLEQERGVWAVDSADLIARIQENEFIIQELNDRIVENEKVIAEYESNVQATMSERQHLESEFFNIRDQLQANLAQCAELKQCSVPVCIPITSTVSIDMSGGSTQWEKLVEQKNEELKAQAASWNLKFEDLEAHANQRVESIREALATQFEAQAAAQHIESHMLEDKVATLEGLLAAAQHELQQYHESHPEPAEGAAAQDSEELRALQAGVARMKAKVASKSKQILLLNQQMLRDRQNFHKLKKSLVKLDELKAMVFANNFNPAVPAPPLPPNQVSELFHLGMEEATNKFEKRQQQLLAQQEEEFQVIRNTLERTLSSLEQQEAAASPASEGVRALSETIHALHGEIRDQAAAYHESQRRVQEMRERSSAKEAAHYLVLTEKSVECNALRAALADLQKKHSSGDRTTLDAEVTNLQEQLSAAQIELQVMGSRQAEESQKFRRAVHTIKVLEARGDALKEECAAVNAEILKMYQKASSRKK